MGRFSRDKSIFADEDALRDSYIPDKMLEREEEMANYSDALQPIIDRKIPNNIFVYGQTGMGKTLATQIMTSEIQEDVEPYGYNVETIWVNCNNKTSYKASISLVNKLRDDDNQVSKSGHSESDIHDMLYEEVEAHDAEYVIIVLDEVDRLGSDPGLLYQIPRSDQNKNIENTQLSLIGISNDFKYRDQLDSKTKSSLYELEVHFRPYDAYNLRSILSQRADDAFYNEVLDDAVIPFIAAVASQDTGSARQAIDILHKAGSIARKNGCDNVTEEHAEKASDAVEKGKIMKELQSLTRQSHLVLHAITLLENDGKTPARRKDIYELYSSLAEEEGSTVKSGRTIHNRLSDLALSGFLRVSEVNRGESGGKYHNYELDMPIEAVADVLKEETRLDSESLPTSETKNATIQGYN